VSRIGTYKQPTLFGPVHEAPPSGTNYTSWAVLAVLLVVIPWSLVGWLVWTLVA
jgi:hypothetical protein